MAHEQLNLTNDELLSTTRAVRKRLDFDRDVPMSVIKECMEIAVQAPTGSNAQGWQFMFVTDSEKRKQIGAYYQQAFTLYKEMPVAIHKLHADSADQSLTSSQTRSASSAASDVYKRQLRNHTVSYRLRQCVFLDRMNEE